MFLIKLRVPEFLDEDEEGIILPKLCEIGAVSITNLLVYYEFSCLELFKHAFELSGVITPAFNLILCREIQVLRSPLIN